MDAFRKLNHNYMMSRLTYILQIIIINLLQTRAIRNLHFSIRSYYINSFKTICKAPMLERIMCIRQQGPGFDG